MLGQKLSDLYAFASYNKEANEFMTLAISRFDYNEEELGKLYVEFIVYKGNGVVEGKEIVDLRYKYTIEKMYLKKKKDYYYTLEVDKDLGSEDNIRPKPNTEYAFMGLDLSMINKIMFDQKEMYLELYSSEKELTMKSIPIDPSKRKLKVKEKRRETSGPKKLILDNQPLDFLWQYIDENNKIAYTIEARIKERYEKNGVVTFFGRLNVSKVKRGKIKKPSGFHYYDYTVNGVETSKDSNDEVIVKTTINNYDIDKKIRLKKAVRKGELSNLIKNAKEWKVSLNSLKITDNNGKVYTFKRITK